MCVVVVVVVIVCVGGGGGGEAYLIKCLKEDFELGYWYNRS